jgi:hypothetical protein
MPHGASEFDEAYDRDLAAMQRQVETGDVLNSNNEINQKHSLSNSLFSAAKTYNKNMDGKNDSTSKSGNLFDRPSYSTNSASYMFSDPPVPVTT